MKLTAIGGTPTRVEIVVVADQQAAAPSFATVASDRFRKFEEDDDEGPLVKAGTIDLYIGHPDAVERMWEGCVITKLSADLAPAQMAHDVELTLGPVRPSRQHLYSSNARWDLVQAVLMGGGVVLCVATAVRLQNRRRPDKGFAVLAGVVVMLTLTGAAIAWRSVEVTEVEEITRLDHILGRSLPRRQLLAARLLIDEGHLHADTTEPELKSLLPRLQEESDDPTARRIERSPGNLSLRRRDGQTWLCTYGIDGHEHRLRLPKRPATRPSQ